VLQQSHPNFPKGGKTMKTPFSAGNSYKGRNSRDHFNELRDDFDDDLFGTESSFGNGAKEKDIRDFTQKMLEENNTAAVITRDGRIVPKNSALKSGDREFTELYKERVWG
jgi:hypothetical protein